MYSNTFIAQARVSPGGVRDDCRGDKASRGLIGDAGPLRVIIFRGVRLARTHELPRDAHPLAEPSFPVKFHALHRRVDLLHDVKDRSALLAVGSNLRIDGRENALLGPQPPERRLRPRREVRRRRVLVRREPGRRGQQQLPVPAILTRAGQGEQEIERAPRAIRYAGERDFREVLLSLPGLRLLPIEARNVLLRRAPRAVRDRGGGAEDEPVWKSTSELGFMCAA